MDRIRTITLTWPKDEPAPQADDFLASMVTYTCAGCVPLKQQRIGTCYHVVAVHIKSSDLYYARYRCRVVTTTEVLMERREPTQRLFCFRWDRPIARERCQTSEANV